MDRSPDELAGVVDGFGGLTRSELRAGLADLDARSGTSVAEDALSAAVDAALEGYYLLELEPTDALSDPAEHDLETPILVAGPAALPRLPPGGEDLPHLLDIEPRSVDRGAIAEAVEANLRADAAGAIANEDATGAERLLDACYEVEAWGPVDLADAKAGLADLVE